MSWYGFTSFDRSSMLLFWMRSLYIARLALFLEAPLLLLLLLLLVRRFHKEDFFFNFGDGVIIAAAVVPVVVVVGAAEGCFLDTMIYIYSRLLLYVECVD